MYIALGNGTYAKEATPDPQAVFTLEELQQEKERKQQEVEMYENEITHLQERKAEVEAEIEEINNLIQ